MTAQRIVQSPPQYYSSGFITPQTATFDLAFGHGETILLADGAASLLKLGVSLLARLNYQVLTAQSEEQVIQACSSGGRKIDLMILDAAILRKSGEDLLNRVQPCQPGIKVLLYTTHDWQCDRGFWDKIGQLPVISKPYRIRDFSKLIEITLH